MQITIFFHRGRKKKKERKFHLSLVPIMVIFAPPSSTALSSSFNERNFVGKSSFMRPTGTPVSALKTLFRPLRRWGREKVRTRVEKWNIRLHDEKGALETREGNKGETFIAIGARTDRNIERRKKQNSISPPPSHFGMYMLVYATVMEASVLMATVIPPHFTVIDAMAIFFAYNSVEL